MEFIPRTLLAIIVIIASVMLFTSILTFFGVPPHIFNPYMFYSIAMVVLWLFLSPEPVSLIRT